MTRVRILSMPWSQGIASPAPAASTVGNIFVSPTGSDSAAGTETNPFRTINKAASVVNPDDIVVVEDGIWSDVHTALGTPSIVEVGRGGTTGHPVTFRARNYLGAKLDGLNGDGFGGANQGFNFRNSAAFVNIQGFEMYGMASTTGSCAAVDMFGGGADSRVTQCYIRHCGRICITHGFGQNGIYVGQPRVIVERSKITDIGRLGPTEGCSPAGPYQSNDHGIYHAAGDDLTVRNSIFWSNVHGWSIQEYPSARARSRILYNTFALGNPYFNFTHIVLDATFTDALIGYNVFYDVAASQTIKVTSFAGNLELKKNITTGSTMTDVFPVAGITYTGNSLSTDALLVNVPLDFTLAGGSPARNAGDALVDVTEDFNGTARPAGGAYDIGAYEG